MGRRIGDAWVTDLTHFMDESGDLHAALAGPGRRLALHMTAIVAVATGGPIAGIRCRRRPDHRACAGTIAFRLWADQRITWGCPICGDNGVISNWQATRWDHRAFVQAH